MYDLKLAVDLDETLSFTNVLWAQHHIKIYGNPENLSAEDIIKKYKFVKDVPYWQFEDAFRWVEEHINSNEKKLEIPVIEESIKVMQKLPVICYLSNRPKNTINGTKKWLRKNGFPNKKIISSNKGLEWKAQKLIELFPKVTGIIDDNSDLLNYLDSNYKGKIFLYYSDYDFKKFKLDVILCPSWADIEKEVKKLM